MSPTASGGRRGRRFRWLLALGAAASGLLLAWLIEPSVPAAELEAQYAPPPSQFAELAGQRTHYRDEGQGPCLLLIHGTASSLHTWDGWVEVLADRFRILRLDLPGYGLTGANPDHDYSVDHRLAVIDGLRRLAGEERCSLAGNSLGGMLAWRYALAHPERVDRLVLVDAAGFEDPGGGGGGRVLDLVHVPVVNRLLTRITPRSLVAKGLRQVYGDPGRLDPSVIDRHHRLLLREGNREALVAAALARREVGEPAIDPAEALATLTAPTLVLWGELDTWIPPEHARRFHAALPDSELAIFEDAGHVPMEELPVETAERVAEFLLRPADGDPPALPDS